MLNDSAYDRNAYNVDFPLKEPAVLGQSLAYVGSKRYFVNKSRALGEVSYESLIQICYIFLFVPLWHFCRESIAKAENGSGLVHFF